MADNNPNARNGDGDGAAGADRPGQEIEREQEDRNNRNGQERENANAAALGRNNENNNGHGNNHRERNDNFNNNVVDELDDHQLPPEDLDRHDGIIDGGVAGVPSSSDAESVVKNEPKRKSSECDLVIEIECSEKLQKAPSSVCSRIGSVVAIGLHDKSTKMDSLFKRYVLFCSRPHDPLLLSNVEFVHHQVLCEHETAEGCALMKGDRIYVRRRRAEERMESDKKKKSQRESDREYLKQLRGLFLESVNSHNSGFVMCLGGPNVLLECRPYLEIGQRGVQHHFLKGHECLLAKRCPWLGDEIAKARNANEQSRRDRALEIPSQQDGDVVFTIPIVQDRDGSNAQHGIDTDKRGDRGRVDLAVAAFRHPGRESPTSQGVDGFARGVSGNAYEDDEDAILHYEPEGNRERLCPGRLNKEQEVEDLSDSVNDVGGRSLPQQEVQQHRAGALFAYNGPHHQVVADDDEGDVDNSGSILLETENDPLVFSNSATNRVVPSVFEDMICVPMRDHPPEAVKLLLEYCYTNRVVCLGRDAFLQASKGAVPPYSSSSKWPNHGNPSVSIAVALAGISLAEQAGMSRLSLMCEVAASNLITNANVLEALSLCTEQSVKTGNRLPLLRKKAMSHLMCIPVLKELSHKRKFLSGLKDRKDSVVPAILQGTRDIDLPPPNKRKVTSAIALFEKVDEEDRESRNLERLKRRTERQLARNGSGIAPFVWPSF